MLRLLFALPVLSLCIDCAAAPRSTQFDAWSRADANTDGALSREEARRLPRLARHFDVIDKNGDGLVSGAEVRAWRDAVRSARRTVPRAAEAIIRQADRDGDGTLSRAEFQQGLPRFAAHFERIDANRDGSLVRNELQCWLDARGGARRKRAINGKPHGSIQCRLAARTENIRMRT